MSENQETNQPNEQNIVARRRNDINNSGAAVDENFPRCALALSGGGIRSATFSLGVIQAIAEAEAEAESDEKVTDFKSSFLSKFDYLSTVSGGGYIGAFLCGLFVPNRLEGDGKKKAANAAMKVLTQGVPGRIKSSNAYGGEELSKAPLAWLRDNGRYLTPTGAGDGFYVAALTLRNWIALHCVIGILLIVLISITLLIRAGAAILIPGYMELEQNLLSGVGQAYSSTVDFSVKRMWWSPLSVLWVAPMATLGVIFGCAYWMVMDDGKDHVKFPLNQAHMGMGGLCVLCGIALYSGLNSVLRNICACIIFVSAASLVFFWIIAASNKSDCGHKSSSGTRKSLTNWLSYMLNSSILLAWLGIVDTLGQTLYLAASKGNGLVTTLSPAGFAAILIAVARQLAKKDGLKLPGWLKKIPATTLAGVAGVVIFALVGSLWSMFVQWIIWEGYSPAPEELFNPDQIVAICWIAVLTTLVALINGFFPGFINNSGFQAFYASRLTRAYLGASNGKRFSENDKEIQSASEPMSGDEVRMEDYWDGDSLKTWAPVHIINVTVNKTVDPAEQLVQRDRKGQPLAVLPFGLALDSGKVKPFPNNDLKKLPHWWCVREIIKYFVETTSVRRPLSVGQWIATSGAAFSTGIGRETSLGMSLLLGAANVRLGVWWPTGFVAKEAKQSYWFMMQRYLSYELLARFHGTRRTWQYLSDGGHFENTGIYELLRPERKIEQIFACDNGADPDYNFDDLANLFRLAKIDMKTEFSIVNRSRLPRNLQSLFGSTDDFKRARKEAAVSGYAPAAPCALLIYAKTPYENIRLIQQYRITQIVLVKPFVVVDSPFDVQQYAVKHPAFPQEPTADQFFDEAQWESYRALGYGQAKKIFEKSILDALKKHHEYWEKGFY